MYSHLDFSSKAQSANIIANALDLEKKPEKEKTISQENDRDIIKRMLKEMVSLGLNDISDYLAYIEKEAGAI